MDEELRDIERISAASEGDVYIQANLLKIRMRKGDLSFEVVRFAAGLGHPAALLLSPREERTSRWLPEPDFIDSWYRESFHLNRDQCRGDFEILLDAIGVRNSISLLLFLIDLSYDQFCGDAVSHYPRPCRMIRNMLDTANNAINRGFSHRSCEPARRLAQDLRDFDVAIPAHHWDVVGAAESLGWAINSYGYTQCITESGVFKCEEHPDACPWLGEPGDLDDETTFHFVLSGLLALFERNSNSQSFRPRYMLLPLADWLLALSLSDHDFFSYRDAGDRVSDRVVKNFAIGLIVPRILESIEDCMENSGGRINAWQLDVVQRSDLAPRKQQLLDDLNVNHLIQLKPPSRKRLPSEWRYSVTLRLIDDNVIPGFGYGFDMTRDALQWRRSGRGPESYLLGRHDKAASRLSYQFKEKSKHNRYAELEQQAAISDEAYDAFVNELNFGYTNLTVLPNNRDTVIMFHFTPTRAMWAEWLNS